MPLSSTNSHNTLGRSWWLKVWTGSDENTAVAHAVGYSIHSQTLSSFYISPNSTAPSDPQSAHPLSFYLGIYIAFSAASSILGTWRYFWIYTGSIRASRILFDQLCFTILRTPLRWMDTVPLGRILNRFTADFNVVDSRLSNDFSFGAHNIFRLIGVIVAGSVLSSPPIKYLY
jgi:ABC-type multidrug transport system fused ATPase/permease subunit